MLLDSSPQILIWKTGWRNFIVPARDQQSGVVRRGAFCAVCVPSLVCWHSAPDVWRSSWLLPCSPACFIWEKLRPVMGKVGLHGLCLFLDRLLQKALGLCVRDGLPGTGSAPLLWPRLSTSTHSLALRGREVGPVSTATLPAAPRCSLRKESYESSFNLVPLALCLAEIPQSWWHIDGTHSCSPMLKQIPPYFYTPLVLSVTFRRR